MAETILKLKQGGTGANSASGARTALGLDSTANLSASTDKNFVTDAEATIIGNTSGTNTGDQTNITGNAATVTTNANLTGEITSTGNAAVLDVTAISNRDLVTAVATDMLLIQDATDGTLKRADASDFLGGSSAFSALTSATNTAAAMVVGSGASLSASGTGTITATDVANAAVIAKLLTAYSKSAGTVASTDSILEAIQKLDANDDAKAPLASPTFTGDVKGISVPFSFALSDETTAITTGTSKITFRVPYACTLTDVRASLSTASSSGIPTFDINKNGTTVLSTKLTIDASEKTSITAVNAAVISVSSFADDDEVTVDIDVSGTDATGAKVTLYLTRV